MKIKVFEYIEEIDAFKVAEPYASITNELGLNEWTPVVWIGRLFTLDNDYGEHWFDNWDLREKIQNNINDSSLQITLKDTDIFAIDPDRFINEQDGPCHTSEFRKRFWRDVLQSLFLEIELIFDEARNFNNKIKDDPYNKDDFITDLEDRICSIRDKLSKEKSTIK